MSNWDMGMAKARKLGYRPARWSVGELVKALGPEFTVYVSYGHVWGEERFGKERLRLAGDRAEVILTNGGVIAAHPLDRRLRILVK